MKVLDYADVIHSKDEAAWIKFFDNAEGKSLEWLTKLLLGCDFLEIKPGVFKGKGALFTLHSKDKHVEPKEKPYKLRF